MLRHKGTVILETERLILRPFRIEDAEDMFHNWASDPEVTRYLTWLPHRSVMETENLLSAWSALYDDPHIYLWVMELKSTGQAVGSISMVDRSEQHEHCSLGYALSRPLWGQGLMAEGVRAVLGYLFREVGCHRVQAWCRSENTASARVMEKCGMKQEACLREIYQTHDGDFADLLLYSILAHEWKTMEKGDCVL